MADPEDVDEAVAEAEAADVDDVKADESGTVTSAYRWQYLSSVVTLLVVVGYSTLVLASLFGKMLGFDVARVGGGTWATYSLAFIAVIAYSVGVDTLRAAQEARQGGGG